MPHRDRGLKATLVRTARFRCGAETLVCVWRDGDWHAVPAAPGHDREAMLAALADPTTALATARPLEPAAELQPLMPYLPARDVFCLGKNYRAHAEEFSRFSGDAQAVPGAPVVFTKSRWALCGPRDNLVVAPPLAAALDYEVELAVVIGLGGGEISAETALDHVAGYSVLNDTTARDLQRLHTQWFLSKSLPKATPWGPVVVTPDELEPFAEREICSVVNGELRQHARLGQMIFSVQEAIASISRVLPLQPGDLVAMGTPSGVGVGFDPPRFLAAGDNVVCRIEGIGELNNSVVVRGRPPEGGYH